MRTMAAILLGMLRLAASSRGAGSIPYTLNVLTCFVVESILLGPLIGLVGCFGVLTLEQWTFTDGLAHHHLLQLVGSAPSLVETCDRELRPWSR